MTEQGETEHGDNDPGENDLDGSRVALAGSADLELVVRALTESFFTDPVMMWAFADEVRMARLAGMWRLLTEHGYVPEGAARCFLAAMALPSGRLPASRSAKHSGVSTVSRSPSR